jgi:hypothetical protein
MKTLMIAVLMTFGMIFTASATENNTILIEERANHLTDEMIRELRLNNYQSNEIREINTEIIEKMMAIETEFKGNQKTITQKVKALFNDRDRKLENILSTVQYNKYFGKRTAFNKIDQEFVANANTQDTTNDKIAGNASKSTKDALTVN